MFDKILKQGGSITDHGVKLAGCILNRKLSDRKIEKLNGIMKELKDCGRNDLAEPIQIRLQDKLNE